MTKFEKLEEILYKYKQYEVELKGIELDIKEIGSVAMKYDDMPTAHNISSQVESNYDKLERFKIEKLCIEIKKEKIDNMLRLLNDYELKLIKMRYFDKLESREIARRLHIHETTLYKKRRAIFDNKLIPFAERFKLI